MSNRLFCSVTLNNDVYKHKEVKENCEKFLIYTLYETACLGLFTHTHISVHPGHWIIMGTSENTQVFSEIELEANVCVITGQVCNRCMSYQIHSLCEDEPKDQLNMQMQNCEAASLYNLKASFVHNL